MDLIIILALIVIVIIVCRDFKCFIYSLGVIEIFFRVMNFIADNCGISELSKVIHTYIPSSIISILNAYSNGLLNIILVWIFVIFMGILDFYLVKYLIKRK
jgi:hypothetical protein